MEQAQDQAPVIASSDDIDKERARLAFAWTSMTPEVRGESRRREYADTVNALYAELWPLAGTDEQRGILAAEMERYRQGYLSRMNAWLSSHANVASAMITGPANFPTARNQKRSRWADNKADELREWEAKARAAVKRKLMDARPEEAKNAEEWERIRRGIVDSLETVRGIDAGTLPYSRPLIVSNMAGKIERLACNGEAELVKNALDLIRKYNATAAKPAVTDKHKLWGYAEVADRAAAKRNQAVSAGPEVIAKGQGVEIIANPEADRVQILFAEKPSADVIAKLKSEAWKWSPREGAWQRKLTEAAKYSARRIVGL